MLVHHYMSGYSLQILIDKSLKAKVCNCVRHTALSLIMHCFVGTSTLARAWRADPRAAFGQFNKPRLLPASAPGRALPPEGPVHASLRGARPGQQQLQHGPHDLGPAA